MDKEELIEQALNKVNQIFGFDFVVVRMDSPNKFWLGPKKKHFPRATEEFLTTPDDKLYYSPKYYKDIDAGIKQEFTQEQKALLRLARRIYDNATYYLMPLYRRETGDKIDYNDNGFKKAIDWYHQIIKDDE